MLLYVSAPMRFMPAFGTVCLSFKELPDVQLYIPKISEAGFESDLIAIRNSDLLLVSMDRPSIGTAMEVSYAYFNLHIPIVGYSCISHPWLNRMLTANFGDTEEFKNYVTEIINNLKT